MSRLLAWLSSIGAPWLGPRASPRALVELSRERVRTNAGPRFAFLPYLDDTTDETEAMRGEYRRMLRQPYIKAALLDKVLTVAALDASVNAGGPEEKDRLAGDLCGHALGCLKGGLRSVCENVILPGLIDGLGVAEKVMALETRGPWAGKLVVRALRGKDIELFRPEVDEYGNITGLLGMQYNTGETFSPANFVIWSHLPLYSNPTGMSDLRAAYRSHWLIDTSWKLRMIALEKYSTPMLKGTYNDSDQRAAMEEAMERARGGTWISVPQGAMVEAMNLGSLGTADYKAAIDDLKNEVFLGISGAVLQALEGSTTEGRGSSSIHKSTADIRKWYVAACVQDVVSEQLFVDLTELNFAGAMPPKLVLGGVDDHEMAASLAIDQGLVTMGLPLSRADLYRRYGRPKPEGNDVLDPGEAAAILAARRSGTAPAAAPMAPAAPAAEPAPQPGTVNAATGEPGVSPRRTFRGRPGEGRGVGGPGGSGRGTPA